MKTKESILMQRFTDRLQRNEENVKTALQRLSDDQKGLNDYVARSGNMMFYHKDKKVNCTIGTSKNFIIHDNAMTQLSSKLKIPTHYIKRLTKSGDDWERILSTIILQSHAANMKQEKILVRAVNNQIRAFLSDSFKRYDTMQTFVSFLESTQNNGYITYDAHYDGLNGYIESIHPDIIWIGDEPIMFGVRVKDGNFGTSSLSVNNFIMKVVCMNGLVGNFSYKEIHRGSKIQSTQIKLQQDTMEAETKAKKLFLRDAFSQMISEDNIGAITRILLTAMSNNIDLRSAIEDLNKDMLKEEIEMLETKMLNRVEEDGIPTGNSLYALAMGISAVANDIEDRTRQRELQQVAGNMVGL